MPFWRKTHCPNCRAIADEVGFEGKAWCPACGWNREPAEKILREETKTLKWVGASVFVILLLVLYRSTLTPAEAIATSMCVASAFVALPLAQWLKYRRFFRKTQVLANLPKPITQAADSATDHLCQRISQLPAPRRVRTTWKTRGKVLLYAATSWVFFRAFEPVIREGGKTLSWEVLLVLALALVPPYLFIRRWLHERPLLAEGNFTIGRIVAQQATGRYNTGSAVTYTYHCSDLGEGYAGSADDFSKTLFEGMPVIVFYDPIKGRKHVALGCSHHELSDAR